MRTHKTQQQKDNPIFKKWAKGLNRHVSPKKASKHMRKMLNIFRAPGNANPNHDETRSEGNREEAGAGEDVETPSVLVGKQINENDAATPQSRREKSAPPHDSAIPPLGMHPGEVQTHVPVEP